MRRRHLESAIFGDPAVGDPAVGDPAVGDPAVGDPAVSDPAVGDGGRDVQQRRGRGTRQLVVLAVAMGLVAGTGAGATFALLPLVSSLTASDDYTGGGSGAVTVVVHGGDTSRTIGAALDKAGVVKTAKAFGDAAADHPRSGFIQPGTYALHARMSAVSALAMLLDPANRKVPRVTIREGLRTSEIINILSDATGRPRADYRLALKDPAVLGLPAAAKGNPEGYLSPSTYEFAPSSSAAEQLSTMVAKCLVDLRRLGVSPDKMQRVLTIASLVEAEVNARADRPKVSRVIANRLARPMPLQMDSTVHFISHRRGKVGTTRAERLSKNPYNTYRVAGLPPGPIDSPGLLAMHAAVNPQPGRWIYFVAVNPDTGETRFAVDASGHAANEKLFLKWCSKHPGQC